MAHCAHRPREDANTDLAEAIGRCVLPEDAGSDDEVRGIVDQRLQHHRNFGWVVLAVRIECDDVLRAELDAQRIADAEGVAVPEVLLQYEGQCAGVLGDLVGLVTPAVDHDERRHRQAARLRRHGRQYGTDIVFLLVRADEPDDGGELHIRVPRIELPP